MSEKPKFRIITLDDPNWDGKPFDYTKTPEELEEEAAELERLYPDPSKASYLKYTCHYCYHNKFYLFSPFRSANMNPVSEGFIKIPKTIKKPTPICRECILELSRRNESFRMNSGGY
jgi:hypothetical protein